MTKMQRRYVDYILTFTKRHGYQPTLKQISEHFGKSISNIYSTIKKAGLCYASYRKISKVQKKKLNKELIDVY